MITNVEHKTSRSSSLFALASVGMLLWQACGSSGSSGGTGGSPATGGSSGTGGATATGGATGTGGVTGTGGAVGTGGSGTGGSGTGGAAAGGSGAGGSGAGGSAGANGIGGRAGGAGGGLAGGGGRGGANACRAVSFTANVPANGDAAMSRVMVNLGADLPVGNSPRTVEFWAYILTSSWVGDANTLFEYGNQSVTAAGFGLDFGANPVAGMPGNHATLDPYTNGGFDNDSTTDLGLTSSANQWVHLAMTWDQTAVRTYVNGVLKITTNPAGTAALATASTPLTIGGNPRGAYFNGQIDEFRVWNVARTQAQIAGAMTAPLVGNETGLVGYWKFDEAAGTTVADSVTTAGHTAHPGTLMAANMAGLPVRVPGAPMLSCP
jgi:hypothetical protein